MKNGIGKEFMQRTQYQHLDPSEQAKGLPQPPLELAPPKGIGEEIILPKPVAAALGGRPLRQVIDQRRSLRTYVDRPLSVDELSYLLWCTQGVKEISPRPVTLRTVPSAGARHPLETVVLINRVEGFEPGLYWFLASKHRLILFDRDPKIADRVTEACLNQAMVRASAATFIWIADVDRVTWHYGERGYRYLHLDAGHVCQNLYLAAEGIGCGACAVGAFSDEGMNELLGLDGEKQFVIYLGVVGKR